MSARFIEVGAALATLVLVAACGSKGDRSFESDTDPTNAAEGGTPKASAPDGGGGSSEGGGGGSAGVGYPPGSCNPLNCKSGCCSGDTCLPGTAPAQCGKGGLVCMNCAAVGYGCVNQGCNAAATCTNCDGCCKAGTCNPNGKTQDNSCGRGGAVCKDCTSSSQTCDGNGSCH